MLVAIAVISPVFSQSESDFRVSVDLSGTGLIINEYLREPSSEDETAKIVVIPATIQGYPVREIGEKAFFGKVITSITIPEGVTAIGKVAFFGCFYLASLTLPSSLRYIGEEAFMYCHNIPLATQVQLRKLGYEGRF